MSTKQSDQIIFFHQRCTKNSVMASRLLAAAKIHFRPPNSPFKPVKYATTAGKVMIICKTIHDLCCLYEIIAPSHDLVNVNSEGILCVAYSKWHASNSVEPIRIQH